MFPARIGALCAAVATDMCMNDLRVNKNLNTSRNGGVWGFGLAFGPSE